VGTIGVRHAIFTGAGLVLFCSTLATPAQASTVPLPAASPHPKPSQRPLAASALYSRRSVRLVRSYLRLKLLEMREADLERARKVVERRLKVDSLLDRRPSPAPH
jgi:hypothetical protein